MIVLKNISGLYFSFYSEINENVLMTAESMQFKSKFLIIRKELDENFIIIVDIF